MKINHHIQKKSIVFQLAKLNLNNTVKYGKITYALHVPIIRSYISALCSTYKKQWWSNYHHSLPPCSLHF